MATPSSFATQQGPARRRPATAAAITTAASVPQHHQRLPPVSMQERVLTTRSLVADRFAKVLQAPASGAVALVPSVAVQSLQTDVYAALQRLADAADDFDAASLRVALGAPSADMGVAGVQPGGSRLGVPLVPMSSGGDAPLVEPDGGDDEASSGPATSGPTLSQLAAQHVKQAAQRRSEEAAAWATAAGLATQRRPGASSKKTDEHFGVLVDERRVVAMHRELVELRAATEDTRRALLAERAMSDRKNDLLDYIREGLWREVVTLREQLYLATKNPTYVAPDVLSLLDTVPLLQKRGDETSADAVSEMEAALAEMKKRNVAEMSKQQQFYTEQISQRDAEVHKLKRDVATFQRQMDSLTSAKGRQQTNVDHELSALRATLLDRDDRIATMSAAIDELKRDAGGQQNVIAGYKDQLQRVNTSVNKLLEDKDRELVIVTQQLADAEQRAQAGDLAKQQLSLMQGRNDGASHKVVEQEEAMYRLQQQLNAVIKERDELRNGPSSASNNNTSSPNANTNSSTSDKLLEEMSKTQGLRQHVQQLEEKLAKEQQLHLEAAHAKAHLEAELKQTQVETSRLDSQLQLHLSTRSATVSPNMRPLGPGGEQSVNSASGRAGWSPTSSTIAPPAAAVPIEELALSTAAEEDADVGENADAMVTAAMDAPVAVEVEAATPSSSKMRHHQSSVSQQRRRSSAGTSSGATSRATALQLKEREQWNEERRALMDKIKVLSKREAAIVAEYEQREQALVAAHPVQPVRIFDSDTKHVDPPTPTGGATSASASSAHQRRPGSSSSHRRRSSAAGAGVAAVRRSSVHAAEDDVQRSAAPPRRASLGGNDVAGVDESPPAGAAMPNDHHDDDNGTDGAARIEAALVKSEAERGALEAELEAAHRQCDEAADAADALQRELAAALAAKEAAEAAAAAANAAAADEAAAARKARARTREAEEAARVATTRAQIVGDLGAATGRRAESPVAAVIEGDGGDDHDDDAATGEAALDEMTQRYVAAAVALRQERDLRDQQTGFALRNVVVATFDTATPSATSEMDRLRKATEERGGVFCVDDDDDDDGDDIGPSASSDGSNRRCRVQMTFLDANAAMHVARLAAKPPNSNETPAFSCAVRGVGGHTAHCVVEGGRGFGAAAVVAESLATLATLTCNDSEAWPSCGVAAPMLLSDAFRCAVEAATGASFEASDAAAVDFPSDELSAKALELNSSTIVLFRADPMLPPLPTPAVHPRHLEQFNGIVRDACSSRRNVSSAAAAQQAIVRVAMPAEDQEGTNMASSPSPLRSASPPAIADNTNTSAGGRLDVEGHMFTFLDALSAGDEDSSVHAMARIVTGASFGELTSSSGASLGSPKALPRSALPAAATFSVDFGDATMDELRTRMRHVLQQRRASVAAEDGRSDATADDDGDGDPVPEQQQQQQQTREGSPVATAPRNMMSRPPRPNSGSPAGHAVGDAARRSKAVQCELLVAAPGSGPLSGPSAYHAATGRPTTPSVVTLGSAPDVKQRLMSPAGINGSGGASRRFPAQRKLNMTVAAGLHADARGVVTSSTGGQGGGEEHQHVLGVGLGSPQKPPRPVSVQDGSAHAEGDNDDWHDHGHGAGIDLTQFLSSGAAPAAPQRLPASRPATGHAAQRIGVTTSGAGSQAGPASLLRMHHPPRPHSAMAVGEALKAQQSAIAELSSAGDGHRGVPRSVTPTFLPFGVGDASTPNVLGREFVPLTDVQQQHLRASRQSQQQQQQQQHIAKIDAAVDSNSSAAYQHDEASAVLSHQYQHQQQQVSPTRLAAGVAGQGVFSHTLAERERTRTPALDPAWRQYPNPHRFGGGGGASDPADHLSGSDGEVDRQQPFAATPVAVEQEQEMPPPDAVLVNPAPGARDVLELTPDALLVRSTTPVVDPRGVSFGSQSKNATAEAKAVRGVKEKIARTQQVQRLSALLGDEFTRPAAGAAMSASPNAAPFDEAAERRTAAARRSRVSELAGKNGKVVGVRGRSAGASRPASSSAAAKPPRK